MFSDFEPKLNRAFALLLAQNDNKLRIIIGCKVWLSLKRRFDGCRHGFGGCDGLGGLGRFNGLSRFGRFGGLSGFGAFDGFGGFVF